MSNSGSWHAGSGGGSGKCMVKDMQVTKYVDSASALLGLYCANGDHFLKAKLTVRKSGKKPLEYITVEMEKVLITSIETGGSSGEEKLTESVTLNFRKVSYVYTPQKEDGTGDGVLTWNWDIAQNVGE